MEVRKKGRITIPASVRRDLGIGVGEELELVTQDGMMVLKPSRVVTSQEIKGVLGKRKVRLEEIEQSLGKGS